MAVCWLEDILLEDRVDNEVERQVDSATHTVAPEHMAQAESDVVDGVTVSDELGGADQVVVEHLAAPVGLVAADVSVTEQAKACRNVGRVHVLCVKHLNEAIASKHRVQRSPVGLKGRPVEIRVALVDGCALAAVNGYEGVTGDDRRVKGRVNGHRATSDSVTCRS